MNLSLEAQPYQQPPWLTLQRCKCQSSVIDVFGEAVAGISVSGPSHRMTEDRIARLGAMVREAAQTVSQGLGAPGPA